jgi:hypothetical protein
LLILSWLVEWCGLNVPDATTMVAAFGHLLVCRTPSLVVCMITGSRLLGRRQPMPNQPKTPHRSIRIDNETWAHLAKVADQHKISLSEVVRLALADFLRRSTN